MLKIRWTLTAEQRARFSAQCEQNGIEPYVGALGDASTLGGEGEVGRLNSLADGSSRDHGGQGGNENGGRETHCGWDWFWFELG